MNDVEKTIDAEHPQPPNRASSKSIIKRYPVITTALVGLILIFAVYLWKDMQRKNQVASVEQAADAQLKQNSSWMLHLMAKPLVWSIRSEMLRGNLEQVNIYAAELVKEQYVDMIYIVDPGGAIIVSTDKKLEGQLIGDRIDAGLLQTDSVQVTAAENGLLILTAPVMGFDKRMATIILNYEPPVYIKANDAKEPEPGRK